MKTRLLRNLELLGLSIIEAKAYLALLELGTAGVKEIAAQSGLNHSTAFLVLESLTNRGLVTSLDQHNLTSYTAENPDHLQLIIDKHRKQLKEEEVILQETVPELATLIGHQEKPLVKFYFGAEGFFALQQDGLHNRRKGHQTYSFTALDLLQQYQRDYFDRYAEERTEFRQPLKVIYTHKNGPQPFDTDPSQLRETKYVSRDKYPSECSIVIRPWWGLRIYSFSTQKGFIGITIESKPLARSMRSIFLLLWDNLPTN